MLRGCYAFLGSIFSFTQCVSEANLKHLKESMLFNEYPLTAGDLGRKDVADAGQSVLYRFPTYQKRRNL